MAPAPAATNKALTLAARTETRDYHDILELHQQFPLAAIWWAACGKDPGFTPLSLLSMMRRFARVDPAELEKIQARSMDPVILKNTWIRISDEAELQMTTFADQQPNVPIGVAFIDASGVPRWVGDDATLRVHAPSLRGCWPQVYELVSRDHSDPASKHSPPRWPPSSPLLCRLGAALGRANGGDSPRQAIASRELDARERRR